MERQMQHYKLNISGQNFSQDRINNSGNQPSHETNYNAYYVNNQFELSRFTEDLQHHQLRIPIQQQNQKQGDNDHFELRDISEGEIHSENRNNEQKSQLISQTSFTSSNFIPILFDLNLILVTHTQTKGGMSESKSNASENPVTFRESQVEEGMKLQGKQEHQHLKIDFLSPLLRRNDAQRISKCQGQQGGNSRHNSIWVANSFNMEDSSCKLRENTKRRTTNHELNTVKQTSQYQQTELNIPQPQIMDQKTLWKKKWVEICYHISKLKKIAVQSSMFFRPWQLNKLQVSLIGDQGSNLIYQANEKGIKEIVDVLQYSFFDKYMSYRTYRRVIKFIIRYFGWMIKLIFEFYQIYYSLLHHIFSYLPLFHYLSSFYILWETFIFVSTTFLFLYIPFEYSFLSQRSSHITMYISVICPITYGFDMFIRANTKSTENDMIPDFISLLSLNVRLWSSQATYFLFFIRITRSFRVIHLFREQFLLNIKASGIISLLMLLVQLLYYAHIVSCIWYGIGKYEQSSNMGWIIKYEVDELPVQVQYLRSYYYSVITMTTIGYGDITPQTDYEILIVIIIAFVSCCIFGYSINFIGNILSDFKLKNDIYLQEIAKINKYFKQHKVDLDLQARSRQYLDIIYSDKREDIISSIDTLSNLSDYLQKEIKVNVFTKRLKKVQFFNELFSTETLEKIALSMSEKIYTPEQDIIDITISQEPMLYIIDSGSVNKYALKGEKNTSHHIKTIYEGGIIGFDRFVVGNYESDFNYKSVGICSVIQISLSQFLECVKSNSEDYERFVYVKDQLIYNQNQGSANLSCESCWQRFHGLINCPFVFYQGKKELILRQYFREINEQIKTFKRKIPKLCFNARLSQQAIEKSVQFFCSNITSQSLQQLFSRMESNDEYEMQNTEDEENDPEEELDKVSFAKQLNDKSSLSNRDIQSNKYIIDPQEQFNLGTSQLQSKLDKQQRLSLKSTFNRFNAPSDEGYTIIDGVLQNNNQKGVLQSQNSSNDSIKNLFPDGARKNTSDLDTPESSKHIVQVPKSFKKLENYMLSKKISSVNDQTSLSRKESIIEANQYRSQQSYDPNKESRNHRFSQPNRSSITALIDRLMTDKQSTMNRQSLDSSKLEKTLIIDKNNLSMLLQTLPQLKAMSPEEEIMSKKITELFLYSFDYFKVYHIYFPTQNYDQIIENYNKFNVKFKKLNKNYPSQRKIPKQQKRQL